MLFAKKKEKSSEVCLAFYKAMLINRAEPKVCSLSLSTECLSGPLHSSPLLSGTLTPVCEGKHTQTHKTLIFFWYRYIKLEYLIHLTQMVQYFNLFYVIICAALTPGVDSGDLLHRGNISWVPHLACPRTTTQSGGWRHQSSAHAQ